jgi:uncharacterized membrane protein YhaH (DUF805 family)
VSVIDSTRRPDVYTPAMFQLRGRIGRVRYLAYNVLPGLLFLVAAAGMLPGVHAFLALTVGCMAMLAAAVLTLIVAGRRLHDLGHARWPLFGLFIPGVSQLLALWLACAPGQAGANRFGPAPAPNSRAMIALAWVLPLMFIAGLLAAAALAPHKSNAQRARDEMEQAI